jgi:nucleotide-binding universal stress UspA family protein
MKSRGHSVELWSEESVVDNPTPDTKPTNDRTGAEVDNGQFDFVTEWNLEQSAGTMSGTPTDPVFLVVGFDGTEPAQRALDAAARLLHNRNGQLEVVYVAHLPTVAGISADDMADLRVGLDDLAAHLATDVRIRLGRSEPRWHFQRRDGQVAHELTTVAEELRREHSPKARVAVIVGGSAHKSHRTPGSVSMNLEQDGRFPVMVVP